MTAYLYWYPEPGAGMIRTDLRYGLEEMPYRQEPRGRGVLTEGGEVVPGRRGGRTYVDAGITVDDADLHATLRTAWASLSSGWAFGLSASHAKTWAAYASAPIPRGATVIPLQAPRMSSVYSPLGTVAAGDYVVLESGHPHHDYEECRVASVSSTSITLAQATRKRHPGSALVRWREFHPYLSIVPGSRSWIDDLPGTPGRVYRLRVQAVEAIQAASRSLAVSYWQSGPGVGGSNDAPDGKGEPGELLGAVRDEGEDGGGLGVRTPGFLGGGGRKGGGRF